ncbi:hypothetical protein [Clostridium botulinum]|uniref:hypothetical protein n=1 Tax=Clostridium botulinum TaxID=1491 RepID=UPI001C9B7F2B|nr:hypothetical protein [Clostridium botulinum]MBY6838775.1 hypothetical protein [Clostridium botulinum]
MYLNLKTSNCKIECGIPTDVHLKKYELKTGDEVEIYTFTNFLVWKFRTLGVINKIENGLIRIVTNRECMLLSNDDNNLNNIIKLSRKQETYKKGEMIAKGKSFDGFVVE